jgi:hypothetical protein
MPGGAIRSAFRYAFSGERPTERANARADLGQEVRRFQALRHVQSQVCDRRGTSGMAQSPDRLRSQRARRERTCPAFCWPNRPQGGRDERQRCGPTCANRLRAAARSGQETRETAEIGLFDTGLWVLASSPRSSGSMCRSAARLQQSSSRLCCLLWSAPPRPRAFRLRSVAWFSAARRVGAECARRDRATDVDQDP